MKVTIDRFEGEYAVCEREDRTMLNIERSKVPKDSKEGDILIVVGDSITIDKAASANRRDEVKRLMNDLWK